MRVGDTVFVERAGDVIPQVVKVVRELRPPDTVPYRLPETCPVCGERTRARRGRGRRALPESALPREAARATCATSRAAARSTSTGSARSSSTSSSTAGLVKRPSDLFALDARAARGARAHGREVRAEPGRGARAREGRRRRRASSTRSASGTSASASPRCSRAPFPTSERLANASTDELEAVDEIGPTIAEIGAALARRSENREEFDRLRDAPAHRERARARARAELDARRAAPS